MTPDRRIPVNRFALLVAAGVGIFVAGCAAVSSPAATPTPAATASPIPTPLVCQPSQPSCIGPLAHGVHSTDQILTPFIYRIDTDGWEKSRDDLGAFNLGWSGEPSGFLGAWPDPVIAAQDCRKAMEPGVGRTVDEIVTWLTEHEGITATAPVSVTVGGLEGQQLDLAVALDWTLECNTSAFPGPVVAFFVHDPEELDDPGHFFIEGREEMRAILLEAADGRTVIIGLNAEKGEAFDRFLKAATPVVESFAFSP
jgi:hypothetical protein